ncbi:type A chloramphenicol O-acetyltransferase [Shimazuella kribbensis]|uniref:type A chloramphenicol O-acetyltransferase n=1 Tax=Shimazuella kribbensis TaxID=139808 RepID=UPI0004224A31|nr:type A chloramphenicol O-acetyltransferase [Shimazuella kribbensis]
MKFHPIDQENWDRKPYFDHYITQKCTFSLTANIEITSLLAQLRIQKKKFYPAFLYMVSKVLNAHVAFRTCFDDKGRLGYWSQMNPSFTIFHKETHTFSALWTAFSEDFPVFHDNYQVDIAEYGDHDAFFPKRESSNVFPVSMIPWVSFTGFNLNLKQDNDYLLPIFTGGRFFQQENKVLFPLSIQVNHAVCDGYHVSLFINEVQKLAYHWGSWM